MTVGRKLWFIVKILVFFSSYLHPGYLDRPINCGHKVYHCVHFVWFLKLALYVAIEMGYFSRNFCLYLSEEGNSYTSGTASGLVNKRTFIWG